jgi:hypothetical protein
MYTGIANTAGYPGDLSSAKRMYFDADFGRTANEYNHWYYMDTAGGQSGSPVWRLTGGNRYIMTVHAYGNDGSNSNHGTRLNSGKFNDISAWLAADSAPTSKADLVDDGEAYRGFTPTTVYAGTTSFAVWCDIRNQGTSSSGGFWVAYYASTNTIISTADYLIGYDYISNVSPWTYANSQWGSSTFPASIPAGSYYVGWIIDSTGAVNEYNEGNNVAYKTGYKLTVRRHRVYFYTDPTTCGSITFAGVAKTNGQYGDYAGGTYSAVANPCAGYAFSKWVTTGGVTVGSATSQSTTAKVTGGGSLKAVFTPIQCKVTFYTSPTTVGSITYQGGTFTNGQTKVYNWGTSGSAKANVPAGYTFVKWEATGNVFLSSTTANPTTVTIRCGGTLKAVFAKGVSFRIWTDKPPKTIYHIGDRMAVYVRVINPGAALPVRALIYLRLTTGALYGPLENIVTTLPAGFDSGDYLWNTFVIPPAPLGNYAWVAQLRDPGTNALITQDIWEWQLQP